MRPALHEVTPENLEKNLCGTGSMILCNKNNNILSSYWAELGPESEYRIFISGKGLTPLVTTKSGSKTVGAYIRYANEPGILVLLPYIDFNRDDLFYLRKDEQYWNKKATQLGKQFISAIVGIDSLFREGSERTQAPEWVKHERYMLPKEQGIINHLVALEAQIEGIQREKEHLQQTLIRETELKGLLYEKGKPLEASIIHSLRLIGFNAQPYRDSSCEFDVVFESKEGRLIGEAEGKDNKAVNIEKLRQLGMNIQEDFDREQVKEMAKGALIGNARFLPPEERGDFFTEKCIVAAKRNGTALIRTTDLFWVAKYLSAKTDEEFATKCRKAILDAVGVVVFPQVPE